MKHKKIIKIFFTIVFLLCGLLAGRSVFASEFFYESFESQNVGDINGQEGWTGDGYAEIKNDNFYDGEQSLHIRYGNSGYVKNNVALSENADTIRMHFRMSRNLQNPCYATWTNNILEVNMSDGVHNQIFPFYWLTVCQSGQIWGGSYKIDTMSYDVPQSGFFIEDTWYYLEINFRSSDSNYRYRLIEDGEWSAWHAYSTYPDMKPVDWNFHKGQDAGGMWFDKIGGGEIYGGNVAHFQWNDYALNVIYPPLDSERKAEVQPSADFQIKVRYNVVEEAKEQTRFVAKLCDNMDLSNCEIVATNTISEIEADLEGTDLVGYVIFTVPVELDTWSVVSISLADDPSQTYIVGTAFALKGVDDPSLPSATGATDSATGLQQDLGWFGNNMRYLFVPTSDFLSSKTTEFDTLRTEKFPAWGQITDSISGLETALASGGTTAPTLPTMSLYGANNMQMINTAPLDDYIVQIRGFISVFLWFFCAIFSIRAVHSFFKPESKIDTNI